MQEKEAEKKSSPEKDTVYYDAQGIKVTGKQIIMRNKTYDLPDVSSVTVTEERKRGSADDVSRSTSTSGDDWFVSAGCLVVLFAWIASFFSRYSEFTVEIAGRLGEWGAIDTHPILTTTDSQVAYDLRNAIRQALKDSGKG